MAGNPFMIGGAARGRALAGRKGELGRLTAGLQGAAGGLAVTSPPGCGKTSLLLGAADALRRRGVVCAYVDLYSAFSKERLVRIMASSLVAASSSTLDGALRVARDLIRPARPPAGRAGAAGRPEDAAEALPLGGADADSVLPALLDLPQRIAERRRKRVAVLFDDFQEIAKLDGGRVAAAMASGARRHAGVSYAFAWDRRRAPGRMPAGGSGGPLGRLGVIRLGRIPRVELGRFVRERFAGGGIAASDAAVSRLLDMTGCHPYYTQLACREIWAECASGGRRSVDEGAVARSADAVVGAQGPAYGEMWDSMPAGQRSLLLAMAASGQRRLFEGGFLLRHGLGATSAVSRSTEYLAGRGVLEKGPGGHSIADPFFAEWVRRMA